MQPYMCGITKEKAGPGLTYRTDLPVPQINDDEVLIKVHVTAVCGTDVHIYDWDPWSACRVVPPMIVGHETAGDVVAIGRNVTQVQVGDRIFPAITAISASTITRKFASMWHFLDAPRMGPLPNMPKYGRIRSLNWMTGSPTNRDVCLNLWAQASMVWKQRK